ncbi:MAG: helix-turn-helix domain-containing protein, partial [Aurantimicrobium sp.]|uniref:helix-turn-helix domain-containing protein n=1 Tax=Aurantimicrobium sp. TaxID=1930784 RepID=UPI00321F75FC
MDLRVKHSFETRIEVARLFDAGFGFHAVATQLGLKRESVRNWHDQYMQGRLLDSAVMGNKKYSPQLKIAAVEKFLAGTPKQDVLVEFEISTRAVFDKWVVLYRSE